jgi:hypothetical protein
MTPHLERELDRSVLIASVIAEAIQSLGAVPSSHLYVRVANYLDVHEYERVINFLLDKKLVRRDRSHLLTWTGPAPAPVAQTSVATSSKLGPCHSSPDDYHVFRNGNCVTCGVEQPVDFEDQEVQ